MKRNTPGSQHMKSVTLALLLSLLASLFFGPEVSPVQKKVAEAPPPVQVPEAPPVPASMLYIGEQTPSYAFLVDKSAQRLHLYRQEADGPKLVKTFVCATGENSGGKKIRGDKRTPEGVYFFTRVIESKNLSSIYGIRAFPMDYPNLSRSDGVPQRRWNLAPWHR